MLRSLSPDALRIELEDRISPGNEVTLSLPGHPAEPLVCLVRWCRRLPKQTRHNAGLEPLLDRGASWFLDVNHVLGMVCSERRVSTPLATPAEEPASVADAGDEGALQPPPPPAEEPEVAAIPAEEPPIEAVEEPPIQAVEEPPKAVEEPVFHRAQELPPPAVAVLAAPALVPPTPSRQREETEIVVPPLPDSSTEADRDNWMVRLRDVRDRLRAPRLPFLNRVLSGIRSFAVEDGVSVVERRRVGRLPCRYESTCFAERERFQGTIVDISPMGLTVLGQHSFRRGLPMTMAPPKAGALESMGPLRTTIRSCRRDEELYRIGVSFEERGFYQSWAVGVLQQLGLCASVLEQKRRFVRARAHLPVEIRGWQEDFVTGAILDLGRGGALLESPVGFKPEEQIRLVLGPLGRMPVMYLSGLVLHCQAANHDAPEEGFLVRVRFVELNATRIKQLDHYIVTLLTTVRPQL